MSKGQVIEVSEDEGQSRLDRWVGRRFPMLGHSLVQKLLRTGQIRVNGSRANGGLRLLPGQQVRLPPLQAENVISKKLRSVEASREARGLRSRVLFEDETIIALDKPSGLAVQGGTKQGYHIDNLPHGLVSKGEPRPRLVHRLDKDTSGVLVLAKSLMAARELTEAFRSNQVMKTYWAIVSGVPKPKRGQIENRLQKTNEPIGERMTTGRATGLLAITRYEVLDSAAKEFALLGLYPITGRTHQLRVHCANLGTPILGDKKYGNDQGITGPHSVRQLQLHARKLVVQRRDGTQLKIEAPVPSHLRTCLSILGLSTPN